MSDEVRSRRQDAPGPRSTDSPAHIDRSAASKSASEAADGGHQLPLRSELQRKALHLIALVIPASMFFLGRSWSLMLLLPLAALALGADLMRVRSAGFARFIYSVFGFMMRPEERPDIGDRPVINGATWVLISASLLAVLFPLEIAVAAFASFMVADAAAAIVGRTVGRVHWGSNPRTVEGSVAFVVFGTAMMLPIISTSLVAVGASVIAGAATEIPRWQINDNIRVPIVMALVLHLL